MDLICHRARRGILRAFVVNVSLVIGLAGCGGTTGKDSGGPAPSTTAPAPVLPTSDDASPVLPTSDDPAPIPAGTYRMPKDGWSVTDYSVTIPEGWTVQYGHVFASRTDEPAEFGFYGVVVEEIFPDACHGEEVAVKVGPGTDALVAALQEQVGPKVSRPVKTTLGGHPATRVDLWIPKDMTPNCRMMGDNLQIWYSQPADKYLVLLPDTLTRVYILDLDGQRQVFLTQHSSATTTEDVAQLQSVLGSIRLGA
jgi:hypothetical protein